MGHKYLNFIIIHLNKYYLFIFIIIFILLFYCIIFHSIQIFFKLLQSIYLNIKYELKKKLTHI